MLATVQGAAKYRARVAGLPDVHFRSIGDLGISSLGLGSYLGKPDDDTDAGYRDSARAAFRAGCNVSTPAPGVTVALCGMSRLDHVAENLALCRFPPLGVTDVRALMR